MGKSPFHSIVFLIAVVLVLLQIEKSPADPLQGLRQNLPDRVMEWTVKAEDRVFDGRTIFDYIDGAGEIYLSYNMKNCLARRFTSKDGPTIILDIFDMGSSEDAFGVFTHDRDGEPLDVGQGALYRPGWLSFWKDRFFVSIYAEEETVASESAVRYLGEAVAERITSLGRKPDILLRLPEEGLQPQSIRYFHDHNLLDYHYYLSDENILNLGPETKAALAEYRTGREEAFLLLVTYPNPEKGEKALAGIREHYLPDSGDKGIVRLENGKWSAASIKGDLLTFVLEADSPELAENLFKHVK